MRIGIDSYELTIRNCEGVATHGACLERVFSVVSHIANGIFGIGSSLRTEDHKVFFFEQFICECNPMHLGNHSSSLETSAIKRRNSYYLLMRVGEPVISQTGKNAPHLAFVNHEITSLPRLDARGGS